MQLTIQMSFTLRRGKLLPLLQEKSMEMDFMGMLKQVLFKSCLICTSLIFVPVIEDLINLSNKILKSNILSLSLQLLYSFIA